MDVGLELRLAARLVDLEIPLTINSSGGRPKGGYFINGERIPSVTTVIGRFKESGGLMHWAWLQGIAGKDYRNTAGAAATAGTFSHSLIEADIIRVPVQLPSAADLGVTEEEHAELINRADTAFGAYKMWSRSVNLEIVATEIPLVSANLRIGGTIDALAIINGELCLLDWKSSAKVYADHIVQLGAYRELWNDSYQEAFKDRSWATPIKSGHLLRIDKVFGSFEHHAWPEPLLDDGAKAFRLLRELYDVESKLKKVVGR